MSASITVKFTLTRAEVVGSIRQAMLGKRAMLVVLTIFVFIAASPFVTYVLRHSEDPSYAFRTDGLVYSAACLVAIAYLLGVLPILLAGRMDPAVRDQEQVFRFTEKGSEAKNGAGELNFDWKSWTRYRETGKFFFLYPGPRVNLVLPKRAFASDEELVAFRNLLKQKIKR